MRLKWLLVALLVMLLVGTVAFAADLGDLIDPNIPVIVVVKQGSTAITDSLSAKTAPEKSTLLTTATDTALKDEKYPYLIAGSEVTILKYRCDSKMQSCGYWVSCQRGGKEVKTNSPVWISPPPYEVVVSDVFDAKTNTETITLKEDPKLAAEQVLISYCDRQPLGKAVSYER